MDTFRILYVLKQEKTRSLVQWHPGVYTKDIVDAFRRSVQSMHQRNDGMYEVHWKHSWVKQEDFVEEDAKQEPCSKRKRDDPYTGQRDPSFKDDCNQLWVDVLKYNFLLHPEEPPLVELHLDGSEARTYHAIIDAGADPRHVHVVNNCAATCSALKQVMLPENVHAHDATAFLKMHAPPILFNAAYLDACGDVDTVCHMLDALLSRCAQDTIMVAATFKTPRAQTYASSFVRHLKKTKKADLAQRMSTNVQHSWLEGVCQMTKVFVAHDHTSPQLILSRQSSPFIFVVFFSSKI